MWNFHKTCFALCIFLSLFFLIKHMLFLRYVPRPNNTATFSFSSECRKQFLFLLKEKFIFFFRRKFCKQKKLTYTYAVEHRAYEKDVSV